MFPKSLYGYVERALARCKGDAQMAASQAVMKEVSNLLHLFITYFALAASIELLVHNRDCTNCEKPE